MKALSIAVAFAVAIAFAVPVSAQTYTLDWYTVDAGGGFVAGGAFDVNSTIGQFDAGTMTGGGYELVGGFWAGAVAPCPGDLNGDREVNLTDLAALLAHYGMSSGATLADGDLDGDGDVELDDLAALLSYYGTTCP